MTFHISNLKFQILLLALTLFLFLFLAAAPLALAQFAQPTLTVDQECVAFAFAPDGRVAYAVRHVFTVRRWDLQRDDIWLISADGKRKRIVNGEKLVKSPVPYSFAVQSLRWSPDGTKLTAELATSQIIDAQGSTHDSTVTLLLDDTGKEIKIAGFDSIIPGATNASWLADGVTVVYLTEAVKPRLLFAIAAVRPLAGRGTEIFERRTFVAAAWDAKRNAGVAIERDPQLAQPPLLVWLDIAKKQRRELASLDGFLGQLSISPSGKRVAYFRDQNILEVRDLAAPEKASTVQIPYGAFDWSADETRILLRRGQPTRPGEPLRPGAPRRSGDLLWVNLADGKLEPIFSGISFRDFAISPDGRFLGVTEPGRRSLAVYPIP